MPEVSSTEAELIAARTGNIKSNFRESRLTYEKSPYRLMGLYEYLFPDLGVLYSRRANIRGGHVQTVLTLVAKC